MATDRINSGGSPLRIAGPEGCADETAFTIGTLVTDHAQHDAMRATFDAAGFTERDCEYLVVDNSRPPQTCAFRGLDAILSAARGRHVVLCHQDVRLTHDTRADLEGRLAELDRLDPAWALAGNAGGTAPGRLALRITDPHGADQTAGPFPRRVMSLDENFIVVRRSTRVGFSRNLTGFHFYGADICLVADLLGYSAYVVDFHLTHLSPGRKDAGFQAAEAAFRAKWEHALRPRWMQTTCSLQLISGDPVGSFVGRLLRRPYASIARRLAQAAGRRGRPRQRTA